MQMPDAQKVVQLQFSLNNTAVCREGRGGVKGRRLN